MTGHGATPAPRIPGFEIEDRIGFGGFATVYRARQPGLDRTVAIKVVHRTRGADDETMRRFRRECQAIGSLTGVPAVMTVFDLGTTADGDPYLVLEYLDGGSLQEELRATGPFTWQEAAKVARDLAGALQAAHGLGILHRDIKPANVLRDRYRNVRLGDFGIAHLASSSESTTGDTAMTISYAAPEMLRGQRATPASDFYSLGALLYTLLNGQPPFSRPDDNSVASVIARITSEPAPPLREAAAPSDFEALVRGLMAKDPGDRPDPGVVQALLERIIEGGSGSGPGASAGHLRAVPGREDRPRPDPAMHRRDSGGPVPSAGGGTKPGGAVVDSRGLTGSGVADSRGVTGPGVTGGGRRRMSFSSHTVSRLPRGPGANTADVVAGAGPGARTGHPGPAGPGPVDSALGLSGPIGSAIFDSGLRGRHATGGLGYAVDIVFVLDITASMWPVLAQVKQHAMGFHEQLIATMGAKGKFVSGLRVRVIAYRDFLDFPGDALSATPFFVLPEQLGVYRNYLSSLRADGGGDEPESGLEALAVAMSSPWDHGTDRRRQVIVMCTDASAHPLEASTGRVIPGYPGGIPATFDALTDAWSDASGAEMDSAAKRLLLYAPDVYPWNLISAHWDCVLHFPSRAGEGLGEVDFSHVVDAIAGSV